MLRQAQHDKFLLKLPVLFPRRGYYAKDFCFIFHILSPSTSCHAEPVEECQSELVEDGLNATTPAKLNKFAELKTKPVLSLALSFLRVLQFPPGDAGLFAGIFLLIHLPNCQPKRL